jgi:hypothetical protein
MASDNHKAKNEMALTMTIGCFVLFLVLPYMMTIA